MKSIAVIDSFTHKPKSMFLFSTQIKIVQLLEEGK